MAYDKIVDSAVLDANITTIADAVRAKTGTTEPLEFPDGVAEAITNLSASEDLDDVLTEQGEIIDSIQSELVEQGVKMKQAKIVAPSLEEQIIYADEGYLIDKFKVEPITTELLVSLEEDLKAENIAEGVDMFGITGTFEGGGMKFDVVATSSLPADVVDNQIVVLTTTTPTNITVSTYAPAEPIEGDVWVVIGESTYGIAQVVEGVNVTVTFTEAKQYNGTEWVTRLAFVGMLSAWANFSGNLPTLGTALDMCSWEEINNVSSAGLATTYFSIGDTKNIAIDGTDYDVEIVGFDHDDLTNGEGKAGITFGLKNCLTNEYTMNDTATNVGGWGSATLRTTLQNTIFQQLPNDLQTVIKSVNKKASIGGEETTIAEYFDTLFLFAEIEVFGTIGYSVAGEGNHYPRFTTENDRKKYTNNGNAWWLRSPVADSVTHFCHVAAGLKAGGAASNESGVAFGFCV